MLVLSRKINERIVIGDDIVLTINKVNGCRVAIGIEAPRKVGIRRGELDASPDRTKPTPDRTKPTSSITSDLPDAGSLASVLSTAQ